MLRKLLSLGALVVVAVTFGVGNAAAKSDPPGHQQDKASHGPSPSGFSDGRYAGFANPDGFSDGRI